MKIYDQFIGKRPNLSFEIFPPKHDDPLGDITAVLDVLCALHPDYISVTCGAGGGRNGEKTIAVASMIRECYGVEPLVHLTGWGRTKIQVDEFLSRMLDAGLVNVLALRGDRPAGERGDFPHASDLIRYMRSRDDRFCVAAACYPDGHPEAGSRDDDIARTVEKQRAGAEFFISQLFFDNDNYMRFMDDMVTGGVTTPVCAGIMPVVSKAQIKRMIGMCGAVLPERFLRIIDKYGDDKDAMLDVGVQYAIAQVIDLCARGEERIHLYTMNNPQVARRICEGVKNVIRR